MAPHVPQLAPNYNYLQTSHRVIVSHALTRARNAQYQYPPPTRQAGQFLASGVGSAIYFRKETAHTSAPPAHLLTL